MYGIYCFIYRKAANDSQKFVQLIWGPRNANYITAVKLYLLFSLADAVRCFCI